jgi:transposase
MRCQLTDDEWTAIEPMLSNKPRGVPRVNDRRVLNGIFWVLRSGAPWRDLPELRFVYHLLQSPGARTGNRRTGRGKSNIVARWSVRPAAGTGDPIWLAAE